MSDRKIKITIGKDGSTEVDMVGFQGQGCAAEAQSIINKLGESVDVNEKPEFREEVDEQQHGCN